MLHVHAESSITASLEGQENNTLGSETKIRYIATIENVSDLNEIKSIRFNYYLYKYISTGSYSNSATYTTTKVYDEVLGTNGKAKVDNTYYAVFKLTGMSGITGAFTARLVYVYDGTTYISPVHNFSLS